MRVSTLVQGGRLPEILAKGMRLGILHAGGPAPGGNEVCFAVGIRAKDHRVPVLAFRHGYQALEKREISIAELESNVHSMPVGLAELRFLRDQEGLVIGTSRANPAVISKKPPIRIAKPEDLDDPVKIVKLLHVIETLEAMKIAALISIGGDDTMKTANLVQMMRQKLVDAGRRFEHFGGAVHVPKTIDKDYYGIDFTFGFMTAVEVIGRQVKGFHSDAKAAGTKDKPAIHIVEVMGRGASWITAGAAIIGESNYTIALEDYIGHEVTIENLARNCVDVILTRRREGKHYAVITIAEGVGEYLVKSGEIATDEHGNAILGEVNLGQQLKEAITAELIRRDKIKDLGSIHAHKAGYNARQARPVAYDVLLCRALGIAAVDAVLRGDYGNMVSVGGVFTPKLVPFTELIDPKTLKVRNWVMDPNEGLYRLMRAMETPFDTDVDVVKS